MDCPKAGYGMEKPSYNYFEKVIIARGETLNTIRIYDDENAGILAANSLVKKGIIAPLEREEVSKCYATRLLVPITEEMKINYTKLPPLSKQRSHFWAAITLQPAGEADRDAQIQFEDNFIAEHAPRNLGVIARYVYAENATYRFLKGRSPYLHFVASDDGILADAPQKSIFENYADLSIAVPEEYNITVDKNKNGYRVGYGDGIDDAITFPAMQQSSDLIKFLTADSSSEAARECVLKTEDSLVRDYYLGLIDGTAVRNTSVRPYKLRCDRKMTTPD